MPKGTTHEYEVNGTTYTVVEGDSGKDKNGNLYQYLIINDQQIKLYVTPTKDKDNTGKNKGYNVELEIVANRQNKKEKQGETKYEPSLGPNFLDLVELFQKRIEANEATWLEQVAIFQMEYNKLAAAEHEAGYKPLRHMRLPQSFINKPHSQKELKEIEKRDFPWKKTNWLIDQYRNMIVDKKTKEIYKRCQKEYEKLDIRTPKDYFNKNENGVARDDFTDELAKNDIPTLEINGYREESDQRFMARVDERAEQAAAQAQAKATPAKTKPTRKPASRTMNPRNNDGHGMA